jgi:hypothetical protein
MSQIDQYAHQLALPTARARELLTLRITAIALAAVAIAAITVPVLMKSMPRTS